MLKAKELACVENWEWGTSSSKKVTQKIAKKLKNCEGVAVRESDRARQAKLDELSMMQQRKSSNSEPTLGSDKRVTGWSEFPCLMWREFHDPETAGSSGASHVSSPPLTNPSYRTVPRRDSGLPPETLNMMGISDVFWNDYLLEKDNLKISRKITEFGIFFSLEWNQNLQNIRWQQDRRGDLSNKTYPIRGNFLHCGDGISRHTGGTYSHGGMMEYPRFPISELHLAKFPDSMEFESWKVNFKTEVCAKTANPQITMSWITEVERAKSIDESSTSQSILGENRYPRLWNAGCNDSVLHWRRFSTRTFNSWKEYVSNSNVLKNATDSYEEDRFRTWSVSIFMHPELMNRHKDSQTCSLYVFRMMMSKIFRCQMVSGHYDQQMNPLSDKVLEGL